MLLFLKILSAYYNICCAKSQQVQRQERDAVHRFRRGAVGPKRPSTAAVMKSRTAVVCVCARECVRENEKRDVPMEDKKTTRKRREILVPDYP